jgi:hypothetical protein
MTSNGISSSSNGHVNGGTTAAAAPAMIRVESDRVRYSEEAIVADYVYVVVLLFKAPSVDRKEGSVWGSLLLYDCSLCVVVVPLFLRQ